MYIDKLDSNKFEQIDLNFIQKIEYISGATTDP